MYVYGGVVEQFFKLFHYSPINIHCFLLRAPDLSCDADHQFEFAALVLK
jgi:hypothetical protein